jgi:hypothetical protein
LASQFYKFILLETARGTDQRGTRMVIIVREKKTTALTFFCQTKQENDKITYSSAVQNRNKNGNITVTIYPALT